MNFVDFLNWLYASWEHFFMFLTFLALVSLFLRPGITINNNK